MRKRMKLASVLLISCMLLLSGCDGNKSDNANTTDQNTEKPTELTVAFPIFGTAPKEMSLIQEAVNKITREKINATVNLVLIGFADWQQQMMFSSSEKLDLMTIVGTYTSYVSKSQLIPLDKLLETQG